MTENQRKPQKQPPRRPNNQGRPNGPGNDKNGKKPGKYNRNPFNWLIITLIIVSILMMVGKMGQSRQVSFTPDFMDMVEDGQVASVEISRTKITGKLSEKGIKAKPEDAGDTFEVSYIPEVVPKEELLEVFKQKNVIVNYKVDDSIWLPLLYNLLPILLLVAIIYFFFLRGMRGGGGGMLMNFGRSKHRMKNLNSPKVSFKDVAGIEEAKEEVAETIEFLKNPKKFRRIGGRIPRGVLLVGPPGCGKTLLAKAIAGESDVPFFSISGSDFVEMFVGVGASRVRDLFKQAKENSPCIIFLDEIDAIGKKRGPGFVSGGHDEREQTLNAILVEMDGFETNDQVIVIAATNRGDILDHALTRPGRFDRQVVVPLPDLHGRLEILKVHTKKIKMGEHVNLEKIARGTPMFTGAELEALINEAAIRASMEDKDFVEMSDLEEARDKVRWGRAKRSRIIDEEDKKITAYHEAGHALVQSLLPDADPLHKVSIIPRGPYGGATFALPEKDRVHYTRKYCFAQMQVCFAGRIAEELFCDDITSGAQGDIKQATTIAREMVLNWGMGGETGLVDYTVENDMVESYFSQNQHHYSEKTIESLDKEIKATLRTAYDNSKQIIQQNRDKLDNLAKTLLKYETLDAEEVKMIIDGKTLDKPTVGHLLDLEKQKTDSEEKPAENTNEQDAEQGTDKGELQDAAKQAPDTSSDDIPKIDPGTDSTAPDKKDKQDKDCKDNDEK